MPSNRSSTPRARSGATGKSVGSSGGSGKIRLPARRSASVEASPPPARPKPKKITKKPVVETPAIAVEEVLDSDAAESDELDREPVILHHPKKQKSKGKGRAAASSPIEVPETPPPSAPPAHPEIMDPSLRTVLLTRTLVPHAFPLRELVLSDLEANERELRTNVDRLQFRLTTISSPTWRPVPLPPIPLFVRPSGGPSPDYSAVPDELPKSSKPQPADPDQFATADERLMAQRADFEWHQEAMKHASNRMLRLQEIEQAKTAAENKVRPYWADVERKEAEYNRRVAERDELRRFNAEEPARVRSDLEKTRANYEDVRARIAEHRSRIAQAADAKRGLDALAAQMRNLASVARSLDPNIEMTEHISFSSTYVPATIPLELVVAATASFDQAVPMKGKKRTRAEAAGLGFAHLVPHGSVPDGITEADALLPLCDRKLILGEACARCSRLSPCLAVLSDKPRKLNARTMTQTCVSCQVLHVSCGTVGCDYFPGTKRFLRIWNHRVELGEHPMPEAVLQAIDLIARGEGEDVKPVLDLFRRCWTFVVKLSPPKPSSSGGTVPAAGSSRVDPRASLPPKSRVPASLTTLYEQLTPMDRNERHLSVPDALEPGQILRFAMPPDDVPEEDAANVFAERGQAIYEWYCVMNRINAYLAGEKFINRLIRESDPLRYDCVNEPTLSPAVHSPLYPVPVPELRGTPPGVLSSAPPPTSSRPCFKWRSRRSVATTWIFWRRGSVGCRLATWRGGTPWTSIVGCVAKDSRTRSWRMAGRAVVSSWLAQRVAAREVAVPRCPDPFATSRTPGSPIPALVRRKRFPNSFLSRSVFLSRSKPELFVIIPALARLQPA
ncbi:hypothetical protein C8R47DRAFT_1220835 [Mycena vitilis]|nr:hypothetical protein C8R47DRAFT_1220835 [Mycena vitilis]